MPLLISYIFLTIAKCAWLDFWLTSFWILFILAETGGGVHGVPSVTAWHAPKDHRILRTPLPGEILRRGCHLGRIVGKVTRGTVRSRSRDSFQYLEWKVDIRTQRGKQSPIYEPLKNLMILTPFFFFAWLPKIHCHFLLITLYPANCTAFAVFILSVPSSIIRLCCSSVLYSTWIFFKKKNLLFYDPIYGSIFYPPNNFFIFPRQHSKKRGSNVKFSVIGNILDFCITKINLGSLKVSSYWFKCKP